MGCFEVRTHVQLYSTVSLHWERGSLVTTLKARARAHNLELVSRFVGSGCVTADHGALIEDTKHFHTFRDYSLFSSGSFFVVGVVQRQDVVNLAEKRSRRVQRSPRRRRVIVAGGTPSRMQVFIRAFCSAVA